MLLYNNIIISIVFLLVTALTVSTSAQSEEKGINQTIQDISKSTNQPIQNASQTSANEMGEAVPIQKMLLILEQTLQKEQRT
jgi:hypothetical protein